MQGALKLNPRIERSGYGQLAAKERLHVRDVHLIGFEVEDQLGVAIERRLGGRALEACHRGPRELLPTAASRLPLRESFAVPLWKTPWLMTMRDGA